LGKTTLLFKIKKFIVVLLICNFVIEALPKRFVTSAERYSIQFGQWRKAGEQMPPLATQVWGPI